MKLLHKYGSIFFGIFFLSHTTLICMDLSSRVEDLEGEVDYLKDVRKELEQEVTELQEKVDEQQTEIKRLIDEVDVYKERSAKAEDEYSELEEEYAVFKIKYSNLIQELKMLKNTASKITDSDADSGSEKHSFSPEKKDLFSPEQHNPFDPRYHTTAYGSPMYPRLEQSNKRVISFFDELSAIGCYTKSVYEVEDRSLNLSETDDGRTTESVNSRSGQLTTRKGSPLRSLVSKKYRIV